MVNVEEMDARLIMRLGNGSISDIVQEEGQVKPQDAKNLIDRLSATHVPLVEEIGGDLVVVATNLKAATRALVALYHAYPDPIPLNDLQEAVHCQHPTQFRDEIIGDHQSNGLVLVKGGFVFSSHRRGRVGGSERRDRVTRRLRSLELRSLRLPGC